MEKFDIIVMTFASLVMLSIAIGSVAICIKCIQARKRRRLSPSQMEAAERNQQGDTWSEMANAMKQRQLEDDERQMNNGQRNTTHQVHVQPIAGIIVVRPTLPLISGQQPQISISSKTTNETARNHQQLVHQNWTSSESNEQNQHQQMEEQHRDSSRTSTTISSNEGLVRKEEDERRRRAEEEAKIGILQREKGFKSTVWMSQSGNELREEDETEEEDGENTARKVESSKIKKIEEIREEGSSGANEEEMKKKGEGGGEEEEGKDEEEGKGNGKEEEKEEERETEAEKAERELLGEKKEDLPEDKVAELEEKEAIQKAIGPPEPKIH